MVEEPTNTSSGKRFDAYNCCPYFYQIPLSRALDRERLEVSPLKTTMTDFDALAEAWTIWNETSERCILVYRPDVFDTQEFPAPCLPTIYLTHGRRSRRPGSERTPSAEDPWHVTLFMEPEVERDPERFETREEAVAGTLDLAERFADGDIDYRALYQVPREEYFAKLDELTGGG